ncbi:MAG: DUF1579 family protein [Phycisphaerae bacterium]
MRTIQLRGALLLLAFGTLSATAEGPQTRPAEPTSQQEQMEKWMLAAQPGESHKLLGRLAGRWSMVAKFRDDEQSPWQESKGEAEYEPLLDGRFLLEKAVCKFEDFEFRWNGLLGHDNVQKKFTAVWVDNMSTGMETAEGAAERDVITYSGQQDDPGSGEHRKFKWIIDLSKPDRATIEMRDIGPDGKEFHNMTLELTRAK